MVTTEMVDRATGEVIETTGAAVPAVYRPAPLSFGEALERLTAPGALEQQQKLMDLYDRACRALVGPNDVQRDGDREFKKKSAWRKLGRFFGVSTEIVKIESGWEWDEQEHVRHFVARVIVRGTAPWGQSVEAVGLCSTRELRFYSRGQPNPVARAKAEHDCEATAATRATNRAISDLIAAGEVSAEEVNAGHPDDAPSDRKARQDDGPASGRQVSYIRDLLRSRVVPTEHADEIRTRLERGLSKSEARRVIGYLMDLPIRHEPVEDEDDPFGPDDTDAYEPGDLSALAAQATRPAPSAQEAGR